MSGLVRSLHRHPVKGFTPERLDDVRLEAEACFPSDRLYAVENGPSGFDPAAPVFVSKSRFTVLASIPRVALARTRYDDATSAFSVEADGCAGFEGALSEEDGRAGLADWLTEFIGEEYLRGPLAVIHAAGHRFTDHPHGSVSVVNLESVRDLERRTGRAIDPLRFRANLYVEGWPAWSELEHVEGARVRLGGVEARLFKPILRCAATHVDPTTGERDFDLVGALREHYGHPFCGLYLHIAEGGHVGEGDRATIAD